MSSNIDEFSLAAFIAGSVPKPASDVEFLLKLHSHLKSLLLEMMTKGLGDADRKAAFFALRMFLDDHEPAEGFVAGAKPLSSYSVFTSLVAACSPQCSPTHVGVAQYNENSSALLSLASSAFSGVRPPKVTCDPSVEVFNAAASQFESASGTVFKVV